MHPRPRLRPAHGRLHTRVRGRRAVVEDLGVRPPDGGQAAADDAPPRPPEHAAPAAVHVVHEDGRSLAGLQGERSIGVVLHLTHNTDSYRPAAVLPYAAGRPLTRPGGRPQPLAAALRLSRAATRKPGAIPGVPHRWQRMPHHYSASGSRPELDVVLNAACHWREQPLAVAEATTRSTRRASSRAGRRHVVTPARI